MQQSKNHLAALDGLRGVAALAVVTFHAGSFLLGQKLVLLPRAYLAVDFFFILSGFVIAKAYENKLAKGMPFSTFVRHRVVRLYPMLLFASLFAIANVLLKYHVLRGIQPPHDENWPLLQIVLGLLLVPNFLSLGDNMYPLIPPAWSLFFELMVNLLYAAIARYLGWRSLVALIILAGLCLLHLAHHQKEFNVGYLLIQYKGGSARVVFSFFLGVLLYRLYARGIFGNWPKIPAWVLAAVLVVSFLPYRFPADWLYDVACVFFLFPLLVVGGACTHMHGREAAAALWLGRISYPVYLLHWPLVVVDNGHLSRLHGLALYSGIAGMVLTATLLSWLVLQFYDEPVRRWLSGKKAPAPVALPQAAVEEARP